MNDYILRTVKVGFLNTNCYILKSKTSENAIVIDPGEDAIKIKSVLRDMDAKCILILLTHGHFDHILGVENMRTTRAKVAIHELDAHSLTEKDVFSSIIPKDDRPFEPADILFTEEGDYKAEEFTFSVIHTPGHTEGSVCYVFDDIIFTGDTLFKNAIGRTDFIGSDPEKMIRSLKRLYDLPGDYGIYPGHEDKTVLSDERKYNPYLKMFRN